MKTKLSLLLTALALGAVSLQAGLTTDTLSLCGGADDDQFLPPLERGIVTDPFSLCGGADDDQFRPPVNRGIVSDPLGLQGDANADTLAEFDALWNAVMAAPTPPPPPPGAVPPPPAGIVGGDGADFLRPAINTHDEFGDADFLRFLIELSICGGNGNDSLWGGGGTDELWGGGGTDEIVADDTVDWYK